jgi:hypothetical protein
MPPPGGYGSPGYGQGYAYGAPPGPQKTEALAIWSLVLGIGSFVICPVVAAIPAIVTGVMGKKAVDRSGGIKTGRGMAMAGEILGIVNLVGSVIVIVAIAAFVVGATKHTQYTNLQAGDCFNRVSSSSIFSGSVDRINCAQPHDAQTTGSFEATDPGHYPGPSGFRTEAEPQCSSLAQQFVTGSKTGLHILWYYPDQNTWNAGTREVLCSVAKDDGTKLTGSLG